MRVKDALEAVGSVVNNLVLGIRGASLITLIAAALVLAGALAASHQNRVYDAIILKTLGATRGRLIAAYGLEYALLGLATGIFGVAAGSRRGLAGGDAGHESDLRLAAAPGAGGRARRACRDGDFRAGRHLHRARAKAGSVLRNL